MKTLLVSTLILGSLNSAIATDNIVCKGETYKGSIITTTITLNRLGAVEEEEGSGVYVKPTTQEITVHAQYASGHSRTQIFTSGVAQSFGWIGGVATQQTVEDEYIDFKVFHEDEISGDRVEIDYRRAYDYAFDYASMTLEQVLLDKEIEKARKAKDDYLGEKRARAMTITSGTVGNFRFRDTVCSINP